MGNKWKVIGRTRPDSKRQALALTAEAMNNAAQIYGLKSARYAQAKAAYEVALKNFQSG